MLKIKDEVDLKELEKYGFKLNHNEWFVKDIGGMNIKIAPVTRQMVIETYDTSRYGTPIIIYDLIKANLVEKVDD